MTFREHPFFLVGKQILSTLLILGLVLLIRIGFAKQLSPYAEAIGFFVTLVWFCIGLRRWYTHRIVVTDVAIEYYRPSVLNSRASISLPAEWVQNTFIITHNAIGRLLRFGDLGVQTAGGRGEILFRRVSRVQKARDAIFDEMRKLHELRNRGF